MTTVGSTPTSERKHHRVSSSLEDFTIFEIDRHPHNAQESSVVVITDPTQATELPASTFTIIAESEMVLPPQVTEELEKEEVPPPPPEQPPSGTGLLAGIERTPSGGMHKRSSSFLSSLSDLDLVTGSAFTFQQWDRKKKYSEFIQEGLDYLKRSPERVIMLFESPSSSSSEGSFTNHQTYRFHDWPPPKSMRTKSMLGPCRYAMMNGSTFPVYLREKQPPEGLIDHWARAVPGFSAPTFVSKIDTENDTVYAYLPVEQIQHHVNDPNVHYHMAGKDAIHLMTTKTTRLLTDTKTHRPCVVKTTHSMGSKGIFIINSDEEEAEFEKFYEESGHPTFVITDFVDIARNVACHFFIHPNGTVTWFGSNENHRLPNGKFSSDSYLLLKDQAKLKELQLPFVEEVVQYCLSVGFWGFCGVDVLFDSNGSGYLVDINPRVTGSSPALMTLQVFKDKYNFNVGLFRRSGKITYPGPVAELLEKVNAYNDVHEGHSRIVVHSCIETDPPGRTKVNLGVYGNNLEVCLDVLNQFAKKDPALAAASVAAAEQAAAEETA